LLGSDAEIKLATNLENNRGKLPWPVSKGYIVAHYGKNVLEGTKIDWFNPGVTIGAEVGAPVKAVFEGVVSSIPDVAGHTVIIIKHGNYFTYYSNVQSVSVSKGETVHTGQVIAAVAAGDSGDGQIDFSLLKDLNGLNPEPWLRQGGH
jgi:septal ring factor EnvC (AmiA/AmiB activator)